MNDALKTALPLLQSARASLREANDQNACSRDARRDLEFALILLEEQSAIDEAIERSLFSGESKKGLLVLAHALQLFMTGRSPRSYIVNYGEGEQKVHGIADVIRVVAENDGEARVKIYTEEATTWAHVICSNGIDSIVDCGVQFADASTAAWNAAGC